MVAPHVGAWIETCSTSSSVSSCGSHPMWVRGLKQATFHLMQVDKLSHPMWVRGLKHPVTKMNRMADTSHPMWVRGLKHLR